MQDYEDFTRTFAGVGKASAARLSNGRVQLVHVTVAGEDNIPIAPDSDLLKNLAKALRQFGDPRQPLQVRTRQRRFLVVAAEVKLLADYPGRRSSRRSAPRCSTPSVSPAGISGRTRY